jgi:glycosyltransferase involved in cell wall biosynthesis
MYSEDPETAAAAQARLANHPDEPWCNNWVESDSMRDAIRTEVEAGIDLILIETSVMARFLSELPAEVPKILDLHDVYSRMRLRSAESASGECKKQEMLEFERTLAFERDAVAQCSAVAVCSEIEAERARDLLGAIDVHVIPNGVDTAFFQPVRTTPLSDRVLFTGTMSYAPNIEGVTWFVKQVWPLVRRRNAGARLDIVGAEPPESVRNLACRDVVVHGMVPDMRPFYRDAAIVVVPLLQGGGTRLKILEAGACAKAIISTSIGADGLDFDDGRDIILADSADTFAAEIHRLSSAPATRRSLGAHARKAAEGYDWRSISQRLTSLVDSTAGALVTRL